MRLFSSLRSRMFVTSALLAVLSIGVAMYLVNARVTRELEQQLQREIIATGAIVEQLGGTQAQTFAMMARQVADAPRLKAAVDTNDPATVQDTLDSYQNEVHWRLLLVTNRAGELLARVGVDPATAARLAALPSVQEATAGREKIALLPEPDGVLQLVTVPIVVGLDQPDILGTLTVGFPFDAALATRLKEITGSDIAFGIDGQILAATVPPAARKSLAQLLAGWTPSEKTSTLETEGFVALPLRLASGPRDAETGSAPIALIIRSRAEQLRVLQAIQNELLLTAFVAVFLATLLSFAVARSITQPLTEITGTMRAVADTGDLTRKIRLSGSQWQDADAKLLATTFNMLTDSIARVQREMSQKERLSSLGRLSTVIAHEVRNPLMIIKSAVHTMRQPDVSRAALAEAVADIDGEIIRLNRIVNEVLDFARPIRFELGPADLNAICRESAMAAAPGTGTTVAVQEDPSLPFLVTDAERLRIALVNVIANACQAADAHAKERVGAVGLAPDGRSLTDGVTVSTRQLRDRALITVTDHAGGIDPDVLARAFDPYFTTRRGGTGLGLPIAKNVIEGLGGTIRIEAIPDGTEVRIELPLQPAATGVSG